MNIMNKMHFFLGQQNIKENMDKKNLKIFNRIWAEGRRVVLELNLEQLYSPEI